MTTVFGELVLFVQWSVEISFSFGGVIDAQDKERNKTISGMIKKGFRLFILLKNNTICCHCFGLVPLYEKKTPYVKIKKYRGKMLQ
jgi:hypothetical protein